MKDLVQFLLNAAQDKTWRINITKMNPLTLKIRKRGLTPVFSTLVLCGVALVLCFAAMNTANKTPIENIQDYRKVEITRLPDHISVWVFGYTPFYNESIYFDNQPVYNFEGETLFHFCNIEGSPREITIIIDGEVF